MSKFTNLRYDRNILYSFGNTSSAIAENYREPRREGRIEEGVMINDGGKHESRTNGTRSFSHVMSDQVTFPSRNEQGSI